MIKVLRRPIESALTAVVRVMDQLDRFDFPARELVLKVGQDQVGVRAGP